MTKIFVRERTRVGKGEGQPRLAVVGVQGSDLKFFQVHVRHSELDAIAQAVGAEVVMLPRGGGAYAGRGRRRQAPRERRQAAWSAPMPRPRKHRRAVARTTARHLQAGGHSAAAARAGDPAARRIGSAAPGRSGRPLSGGAAEQMGVSRSTFQRIVVDARRKVAQALVDGAALHIEGGTFRVAAVAGSAMTAAIAGRSSTAAGKATPARCPACGSAAFACDGDDRERLQVIKTSRS